MTVVHRLFLLRGSARVVLGAAQPPVVDEGEKVQFELLLSADATPVSWRLRLGDLLPESPKGIDLGEIVRWERSAWFDSCRGQVQLTLERNVDPDAAPFGSEGWEAVLAAPVFVHPTKITEEQWLAMRADLEAVAVELASDLIGKATAGRSHAIAARSPLDEVAAARRLLSRFQRAHARIAEQPHTVLRASRERVATPVRRLDGATIKRLLARGLDPRRRPTDAAARQIGLRLRPSFDVPEHRQMLGTLRAVARRLADGEERAEAEIAELESDRLWRERQDDTPGTSLYDRMDRPRVQRLRAIGKESAALRRQAQELASSPILAELSPQQDLHQSLVSRHLAPYRLAWRAMCAWNAAGRVQVDSGEQIIRRKDTARMYEQWVFLQLASGLRALGFNLEMEEDVFRLIRKRRFLMDLPRGARLSFLGGDGVRLDLHFEPWIRPRDTAERMGDALFHGRGREAAWSPDVLMTFQLALGIPVRGVVVDAKYVKRLNDTHWSGVRKYFQIRRLTDGGQLVDQVWLSAPVTGIRLEDDSISWTAEGPDLPLGAGTIQGELGLAPTPGLKPGAPVPLVKDFLAGLLAHGGVALSDVTD